MTDAAGEIGQLLRRYRPGVRVAVGDGLGAPRLLSAALSQAAAEIGDVRLLLGWLPTPDEGLDFDAFADARTFMSGWGLRTPVAAGQVRVVPVRLSGIPALLHGPLRPDVLVATVVRRPDGGLGFGAEVSWQRAAVDAGAVVAGVLASGYPCCEVGPPLPAEQVVVVAETADEPAELAFSEPTDAHRAMAGRVSALIPEGARLQVGPGPLGTAVLDAVTTPVRLDSGLLPGGVVDLAGRGLLVGEPVGSYLAGGRAMFDWADGRPILHRLEHTHDIGRLSTGSPFVAVNTAIEVDEQAQVNVEAVGGVVIGGIGGHPDYAAAATRSAGGLSIVAVASSHRGASTLVSRLSAPVSTPGHDVGVLVTESGVADLRGLDRDERRRAVCALFE